MKPALSSVGNFVFWLKTEAKNAVAKYALKKKQNFLQRIMQVLLNRIKQRFLRQFLTAK